MTSNPTGPTEQDFDDWHIVKKRLHWQARMPIFKEREVWWAAVGVNIGVETYGKGRLKTRPVIVVRKVSRHGGIIIPLTTRPQTRDMYHHLDWGDGSRWAMMHETRALSVYRLQRRIVTLPEVDFVDLQNAFRDWLGL